MKILFLSDLHLGSPLFDHPKRVASLLHDNYDIVFIVGDIIDEWEMPIHSIVSEYIELISILNSLSNLVIIRGNHDPNIDKLQEIFPNAEVVKDYEIFVDNERIKIIHGHEFDDLILKYYWVAKLFFPFQWISERLGYNIKGKIRDLLHSIAMKKQDAQYNDLVLEIEKRAVDEYYGEYTSVVMGHTHLPKLVIGDFTYVNVGDWTDHSTYVLFEGSKFTLKGEY